MKRGEVTTCSNFTNRPHAIVEQLLTMDSDRLTILCACFTCQIFTAESWPKIPTRSSLLRHTSDMLCYHLNLGASIKFGLFWWISQVQVNRVDIEKTFPIVDLKFIYTMSADFPVIDIGSRSAAPTNFNSDRKKFKFSYQFMSWVKSGMLHHLLSHFKMVLQ